MTRALILASRSKLLTVSDEGEDVLMFLSLPNRAWIPSHETLHSWPNINLIISQSFCLLILSYWGYDFHTWIQGEGHIKTLPITIIWISGRWCKSRINRAYLTGIGSEGKEKPNFTVWIGGWIDWHQVTSYIALYFESRSLTEHGAHQWAIWLASESLGSSCL